MATEVVEEKIIRPEHFTGDALGAVHNAVMTRYEITDTLIGETLMIHRCFANQFSGGYS